MPEEKPTLYAGSWASTSGVISSCLRWFAVPGSSRPYVTWSNSSPVMRASPVLISRESTSRAIAMRSVSSLPEAAEAKTSATVRLALMDRSKRLESQRCSTSGKV